MPSPISGSYQAGQTGYAPKFLGAAKKPFSNMAADQQAKKDEFLASKKQFFQGSIKEGLTRVLKMTFLRPRGYAELGLHFTTGISLLVFPLKHFIEGVVGADSLFFKRRVVVTNLSGAKSHEGRTVYEAIKNKMGSMFNRKNADASASSSASDAASEGMFTKISSGIQSGISSIYNAIAGLFNKK